MNPAMQPLLDKYTGGERINLGSGTVRLDGWKSLDMNPASGADVVHDLHDLPLPFDAESFDAVLMSHVLEHIDRDKTLPLVYDVARILKTGGHLVVAVPYATHRVAYACPLHTQLFDEHSFQYFSAECYEEPGNDGHLANQGQPVARWEAKEFQYVLSEDWADKTDDEVAEAKNRYLNVVRELFVVLEKRGMS